MTLLRKHGPVEPQYFAGIANLVFCALANRLLTAPQFKVSRSVIVALAVLMMDGLTPHQCTSDNAFHYQAMFEIIVTVDAYPAIPGPVYVASSLNGTTGGRDVSPAMGSVIVKATHAKKFCRYAAVAYRTGPVILAPFLEGAPHRESMTVSLIVPIAQPEGFCHESAGINGAETRIGAPPWCCHCGGSAARSIVVELAHTLDRSPSVASSNFALHANNHTTERIV